MRGTRHASGDGQARHLLAVADQQASMVLAQAEVDGKTNEITCFAPLLALLDLAGAVVTARDSISLDDLNDEVYPRWPGVPGDGNGPEIADAAELICLVRIGRVVAVLPRSLMTPAPPGIVCVPVADAGPSRIVIARREHDHRDHVTALVTAAHQLSIARTARQGQTAGKRSR